MKFYPNLSFFNVIIISTKGSVISKVTLSFFGYTERSNLRFPFGFFILLDLKIFSSVCVQRTGREAIEILQESVNHDQFKNYTGLEVIYSLNLSIHTTPKKDMNYI